MCVDGAVCVRWTFPGTQSCWTHLQTHGGLPEDQETLWCCPPRRRPQNTSTQVTKKEYTHLVHWNHNLTLKICITIQAETQISVPQIMELSLWNIVKTIQMISHSHLAEPNSFNLHPKTSVNPVTGFSSVWGLWQDLSRSSPCCWIINALEMLEMSDGSYSLLQNVAAVAHL